VTTNELGYDHIRVALIYDNIGGVYVEQRKFRKALKYFDLALEIRKNKLGVCHENVARTLHNIAIVYQYQEQYEKAQEANRIAVEIQQTNRRKKRKSEEMDDNVQKD
jgi:tetratricopeptide (TPR) repeat protein